MGNTLDEYCAVLLNKKFAGVAIHIRAQFFQEDVGSQHALVGQIFCQVVKSMVRRDVVEEGVLCTGNGDAKLTNIDKYITCGE